MPAFLGLVWAPGVGAHSYFTDGRKPVRAARGRAVDPSAIGLLIPAAAARRRRNLGPNGLALDSTRRRVRCASSLARSSG